MFVYRAALFKYYSGRLVSSTILYFTTLLYSVSLCCPILTHSYLKTSMDASVSGSKACYIQGAVPAAGFIEQNEGISFTNWRAALAGDVFLHVHHAPALLFNTLRKISCLRSIKNNPPELLGSRCALLIQPVDEVSGDVMLWPASQLST